MNTPSMSYGEHMRRNEFSAASRQDGVGPGGSLFNVEESPRHLLAV